MSRPSSLPAPELTREEDGSWTLNVPGVCSTGGHAAPEWAMARAVEDVRRAASEIVRRWIAGKPVTDAEKQVVLLVTRGDTQTYAWLDAALVDESGRGKKGGRRRG